METVSVVSSHVFGVRRCSGGGCYKERMMTMFRGFFWSRGKDRNCPVIFMKVGSQQSMYNMLCTQDLRNQSPRECRCLVPIKIPADTIRCPVSRICCDPGDLAPDVLYIQKIRCHIRKAKDSFLRFPHADVYSLIHRGHLLTARY